jgi:hypothetical protein
MRVRGALLIALRRAILREAFFAEGVLAMSDPFKREPRPAGRGLSALLIGAMHRSVKKKARILVRQSPSALTDRTIIGRPPGLDDTADHAAAAAARTRLALPVVDGETVLEEAKLAIRPHIVAQRGAARLDGVGDYGANAID